MKRYKWYSAITMVLLLFLFSLNCTERELVEPLVLPEMTSSLNEVDEQLVFAAEQADHSLNMVNRQPMINVYPQLIDYGAVGVGEQVKRSIVIRNVGTMPLLVTRIDLKTVTGSFTVTYPYDLPFSVFPRQHNVSTVPPRGSAAVPLYVNFTPDKIGTFSGTIFIRSSDPQHPVITVQLNGKGILSQRGIALSTTAADTL